MATVAHRWESGSQIDRRAREAHDAQTWDLFLTFRPCSVRYPASKLRAEVMRAHDRLARRSRHVLALIGFGAEKDGTPHAHSVIRVEGGLGRVALRRVGTIIPRRRRGEPHPRPVWTTRDVSLFEWLRVEPLVAAWEQRHGMGSLLVERVEGTAPSYVAQHPTTDVYVACSRRSPCSRRRCRWTGGLTAD